MMNTKAANKGDQLKHALILEVLNKFDDLTTYAETHAGAGYYSENEQKEQHIVKLREKVQSNPQTGLAGNMYLEMLTNWWDKKDQLQKYPGSVLQAEIFLSKQSNSCTTKLTEKDVDSCERLYSIHSQLDKTSEKFPKQELRQGNFEQHLDWLCDDDPLFLVVDPYLIVGETKNSDDHVDLYTLQKVVEKFNHKEKAVLMLWTTYNSGARIHRDTHEKFLKNNGSHFRAFGKTTDVGKNTSYHVYVIGFGEGCSVVDDLPGNEQWSESWLKDTIREI